MKISIAIPTYEMQGFGADFLNFSLQKLHEQTFKDFEVVISDHSKDFEIKNLCDDWKSKLNIKYIKNEKSIGSSSANLNNAIVSCSGEFIKILFQDDFLSSNDSLQTIMDHVDSALDKSWFITGCDHSKDGVNLTRPFYPKYHDKIHLGNNTISSPSVLTIRNKDVLLFDENLIWLMDVDYYKRLHLKFGDPCVIDKVNVVNRVWSEQLTNKITDQVKEREVTYVVEKFKAESLFEDICNLRFPHQVLYGRGVVDINEHLQTLRNYAASCDHVTEMGTRFAVSTYAFLIAKPKKVVSIDLNYKFFSPYQNEIQNFANYVGTEFLFVEGDVLDLDIEETDFLFIDTLHTYNQLSQELRKHESKVKKWIALHDTVTFGYKDEDFYQNGAVSEKVRLPITKQGLYPAVLDFLETNKNWVIKEHFTNNNGLTILERKSNAQS